MNWFAPGEPASAQNGDGSELSQAKYLARFFAINAAVDCGAVWWSLYNANGVQEWAVVRSRDLTPRAAFFASGCTSTVLDNSRPASDLLPTVVAGGSADLVVRAYRCSQDRVVIGLWRAAMCDDACARCRSRCDFRVLSKGLFNWWTQCTATSSQRWCGTNRPARFWTICSWATGRCLCS